MNVKTLFIWPTRSNTGKNICIIRKESLEKMLFFVIIYYMERFNPLNDYLFLKLMGEEGDEEQCLAFLNAVLSSKSKQPVKLIKILENKTFVAEVIGEKTSILDVRVETDNGEKANIEVHMGRNTFYQHGKIQKA